MGKGQMEKENPSATAPSSPPPQTSYPGSHVNQSVVVNQGAPAAQPSFQIFVQPGQQNPPQYAPQPPPVQQPVQHIPPQYMPQPPPIVQPLQQVAPQYVVQQPQPVQTVRQVAPQYVVQPVQTVNQTVVVRQRPTETPGQMLCPYCQNTVLTATKHEIGLLAWLICGIVGFFMLWPLCFIPFCVDSCKDVEHYCPVCNNKLHVYKRM